MFLIHAGVIDLISLDKMIFDAKSNKIHQTPLTEKTDGNVWERACLERVNLVDKLSEYSDDLADKIVSTNSLNNINSADIIQALRVVTVEQVSRWYSELQKNQ